VSEVIDVNKVLYKCMSKLDWLEEAWYDWVIADELAWSSEYEKVAAYVKRSLRWLKRILSHPSRSEGIKEHVEWLVKEIGSIDVVDARVENQIMALTPRFRQLFLELLVRCAVEEVKRRSSREG
jgi:hypothetical protein